MTTTKLLLATLALAALPTVLAAGCPSSHEQASMSCADGTQWDADTRSCVPSTS